MPLDAAYLNYPRRAHGYDHELYAWSPLHERPPLAWPGGARVAVMVVVSAEFFPLTPADAPFRAPGHMQTPYPDYRHFTARDYGLRVGLGRLLGALEGVGAKAGIAACGALVERCPGLLEDAAARGHEIVAHPFDMNGAIASTLPEADEAALIARSLDALAAFAPRGWLSVARSQSWATPRLLAGAGVRYCLDWPNDELPYWQATASGPLLNAPLNHELSDRRIILDAQQSADEWAQQIRDAFQWLAREADESGGARMLPLHVTPYILGLPYRIAAFEALLAWLAAQPGVWFAPPGDVADDFAAQIPAP
jgi:peptidoglycan/xylan/chitin deacetylase (PgdA/CDA1 family)